MKNLFIEKVLGQISFENKMAIQADNHHYDDMVYNMDDLDEIFCDEKPTEVLQRAYFGYDYNMGREENRQPFNPNGAYFMFNGYANLVSLYEDEAEDVLDGWLKDSLGYFDMESLLHELENYVDYDEMMEEDPLFFYNFWVEGDFIHWEALENLVTILEELDHTDEAMLLQEFLDTEASYN